QFLRPFRAQAAHAGTDMATSATATTLELTKDVYGEGLVKLDEFQDDNAIVQRMVKFSEAQKLGDEYVVNVQVTLDQGVTYYGADGGDDTTALNARKVGQNKQARVRGHETIGRTGIANKAMEEAVSKGRAAFADATEVQLTSIKSTMQKRLELSLLQGQRGLGIVAANDGGVLT